MLTIESCRLLAQYNRWMNDKLYAAAAALDDEQRRADRGAYFRSIHGTLDHLLFVDLAWLYRFTARPLDGLDPQAGLARPFEVMRAQRRAVDDELADWVETLSREWLASEFSYDSLAYRRRYTRPAWVLVVHLFNHQTHHRGQATTLLMQAGVDIGVTDLPLLPAFGD